MINMAIDTRPDLMTTSLYGLPEGDCCATTGTADDPHDRPAHGRAPHNWLTYGRRSCRSLAAPATRWSESVWLGDVYRPGSPQPTEPHGRNCVTSSDPPQLHGAADHEQMTPPQDVGFPASDSVSWPVQADPAAVVPATGTGQTSAVVDNAKIEVGVTDLRRRARRCSSVPMPGGLDQSAHASSDPEQFFRWAAG